MKNKIWVAVPFCFLLLGCSSVSNSSSIDSSSDSLIDSVSYSDPEVYSFTDSAYLAGTYKWGNDLTNENGNSDSIVTDVFSFPVLSKNKIEHVENVRLFDSETELNIVSGIHGFYLADDVTIDGVVYKRYKVQADVRLDKSQLLFKVSKVMIGCNGFEYSFKANLTIQRDANLSYLKAFPNFFLSKVKPSEQGVVMTYRVWGSSTDPFRVSDFNLFGDDFEVKETSFKTRNMVTSEESESSSLDGGGPISLNEEGIITITAQAKGTSLFSGAKASLHFEQEKSNLSFTAVDGSCYYGNENGWPHFLDSSYGQVVDQSVLNS
jgi:hypothetical protein